MIGLFDRDIFLKLVCCDLWDDVSQIAGLTHAFRLPSTNGMRSNKRALNTLFKGANCDIVLEKVNSIIKRVPSIPDSIVTGIEIDPVFIELSNTENIDNGEQLLVAIVAAGQADCLYTGDKRFILSLQSNFPGLYALLSPKIVSLEQCLLAVESELGYDYVLRKTFDYRACDGTMNICIRENTDRDHFLRCLRSFDPT